MPVTLIAPLRDYVMLNLDGNLSTTPFEASYSCKSPSYALQNHRTPAQLDVLEQFCRYLIGVIVI